jgi:hypothetical protein
MCQALVVHICILAYSGDRYREDHSSKIARGKKIHHTHIHTKAGGMAQGAGADPEFKTSTAKKKKLMYTWYVTETQARVLLTFNSTY